MAPFVAFIFTSKIFQATFFTCLTTQYSLRLCASVIAQSCWPLAFLWNKFLLLINVVLCIEKCFKMSLFAEHFTCVVKMLYNLQFIQALAALSSKFSPDERQAWSTAGALKKVNRSSNSSFSRDNVHILVQKLTLCLSVIHTLFFEV